MKRPLICLLTFLFSKLLSTQEKPNVIIIFCDDMGYADIGPFGGEGYETPNLDRMAEEGMRFTDFHVGVSVAVPLARH